jgi:hypothetical protein
MEKVRTMDGMPLSAGTLMLEEIIILLAPRLRDRGELPRGYEALTVPVSINSGEEIIRSMWDTLSLAPDTLVTLEDGSVTFWRKKRKRLTYHEEIVRGR